MSEATATVATEAAAAPKKKSKLVLIVGLVVLLLAGGGGYWFFVLRPKATVAGAKGGKEEKGKKGTKAAKEEGSEEEGAGEEAGGEELAGEKAAAKGEAKGAGKGALALDLPDDKEVKRVIDLAPFIVNLADKGEVYYLRLAVSVGISGEGEEKPAPLFTTRIRNAMLAVLTTKTSEDVLTQEGKAQLRKELLKAARAASKEPRVEAVYITDLIVQL